jgi:ribosome biogenesis protein BMS1
MKFYLGRKRRITFIECRNDINSLIDVAKIADLVKMSFFF